MCSRDFLAQFWAQEYNALIQFIATCGGVMNECNLHFFFRESK